MEPHPSQPNQSIDSDVGDILANAQTLWKVSQVHNKKELQTREERQSRQLEAQRIQDEKELEEIDNHRRLRLREMEGEYQKGIAKSRES